MRELIKGIRLTLVMWVLTAVIYPLLLLICGQVAFPFQANGSLVTNRQGALVGSALIGQTFAQDGYFWSRPSAINYSQDENAKTGVSGASNLAPSNPQLRERIAAEIQRLQQADIKPTADLVYASGSGLDPHITVAAARNQIERVAKARGLDNNQVEIMVFKNTDGRFLGIFGEPGVNVLKLNLALDNL
ncbi:MAG: K(+)-transporting ATPase subunit C [Oscillatoriaceae cyanobacterium]